MQTMKINIEKYPDYKDSGVEWLGEIPESLGKSEKACFNT